jgi:hypothetical protein
VRDEQIQNLFIAANTAVPEASPYTRTRVLAELNSRADSETREHRRRVTFWRGLSLASTFAAIVFAVLLTTTKQEIFKVQLGQPILVEVNVKNANAFDVAMAEIELPEGVYIYSVAHPEMTGLRKVSVAWSPDKADAAFPFVVKSDVVGKQKIKIRFYNNKNELAEEKIMILQFNG